jgi:hypothetical protein
MQTPGQELGACGFLIELDARFAQKARSMTFPYQQRFVDLARERTGDSQARSTFYGDSGLLRSMAVKGDCACLGISGQDLEANWTMKDSILYSSHNVDTKIQAYDLLTIFTYWIESVELFMTP